MSTVYIVMHPLAADSVRRVCLELGVKVVCDKLPSKIGDDDVLVSDQVLVNLQGDDPRNLLLVIPTGSFLTTTGNFVPVAEATPTRIKLMLRTMLNLPETKAPSHLSKRQKQLLVMLNDGLSNSEIASKLDLSEHTIKVHLWRMFSRLNVKSRGAAAHLARSSYPELF